MGVGPPNRTGRDQLDVAREFIAAHPIGPDMVVLVACTRGAGGLGTATAVDGTPVYPVTCAGNLHTSVVELLIRSGISGALICSCPPRDCWNREGVHWLEQRLFHEREAELQERVDRRRVRLVHAGLGEPELLRQALAEFRRDLLRLGAVAAEADVDVGAECATPVGMGDEA
jgi:coenzyme F420-reducing hydrogenase delta subunit